MENQIDANYVINSLKMQVADYAQKLAFTEAQLAQERELRIQKEEELKLLEEREMENEK